VRHRVVILGGGTAGISVAARLRRAGESDVVVVEPSRLHYYQPLWTLVGARQARLEDSVRLEAQVMPQGVVWVQDWAEAVDPEGCFVVTRSGSKISYDVLVVCPGVELAWDLVAGLEEALSSPWVSSNYAPELALKSAELLGRFRGGRAVFVAPATPIKCPGAPQKAAYMASDYWLRRGLGGAVEVCFATAAGGIFGVPEFARVLEGVVRRYGIKTFFSHDLIEVDASAKTAKFIVTTPEGKQAVTLSYDLLHVAPPQQPPRFVREGPLAGPTPGGWIEVDPHTLQHRRYPNVFALGDASDAPTSKTGAAVRRQAPVVARGVAAVLAGRQPTGYYDGYAACPFTTRRGRVVMAEFDYSLAPHPTIPLVDTKRERWDMWVVKKSLLPRFYWSLMLKGLA
jgi:sulfide:quinone oxidoreductase